MEGLHVLGQQCPAGLMVTARTEPAPTSFRNWE
jgi:hypothetical protein